MAAPPDVDPPSPASEGQGEDAPGARLDERAPFLTWPRIYALVIGAMVVQIVIYTVLTRTAP